MAQGKGVFICQNKNEAIAVLKNMMILRSFGDAGNVVVIEEYLEGEEVSVSIKFWKRWNFRKHLHYFWMFKI